MCPEPCVLVCAAFLVFVLLVAFAVFSVFSVFCAACALLAVLAFCHLRCSYKPLLCCASVWCVVAMWVAMVYDVWAAACPFLYARDVPVGVDGHGDSLRPAGVTVLWQSGVTYQTCPVCSADYGSLSAGSRWCRVPRCWICLVWATVCACFGLPLCQCWLMLMGWAATLAADVQILTLSPVLDGWLETVVGSAVHHQCEVGGTGRLLLRLVKWRTKRRAPDVERVQLWLLLRRVNIPITRHDQPPSPRGIRTVVTRAGSELDASCVGTDWSHVQLDAVCVWMTPCPHWVPWLEPSCNCGVDILTLRTLPVVVRVVVVELLVHALCQAHLPVVVLIRFGGVSALRVHTVVIIGLSGSGSLVSVGSYPQTAGGMARTRITVEQWCNPCMRDDATVPVSAASTGVGVRSRGVSIVLVAFLIALLSFPVFRFPSELVMSCGSRGLGVYGMMLYVLMPCVLVDRRCARYRGSCLSHVGRRISDAVRA